MTSAIEASCRKIALKLKRDGYRPLTRYSKDTFENAIRSGVNLRAYVMLREGYIASKDVSVFTLGGIVRAGANHWGVLAMYLLEKKIGYMDCEVFPDKSGGDRYTTLIDQMLMRIKGISIQPSRLDPHYDDTAKEVIAYMIKLYPDIRPSETSSMEAFDRIRLNKIAEDIVMDNANTITAAPRHIRM